MDAGAMTAATYIRLSHLKIVMSLLTAAKSLLCLMLPRDFMIRTTAAISTGILVVCMGAKSNAMVHRLNYARA